MVSKDTSAMNGQAVMGRRELTYAEAVKARLAMARAARRTYRAKGPRREAWKTVVAALGIDRPSDG